MSVNCDVIVIFPIYGQFGAIREPDYLTIFAKKCCKIKRALAPKGIFSENTCVYLHTCIFFLGGGVILQKKEKKRKKQAPKKPTQIWFETCKER